MAKKYQKGVLSHISSEELRLYVIIILLLSFVALIVVRLLYIQLWEQNKYSAMAQKQYIIEVPVEAQRGLIYDRNMNYLVLNEPCVSIGLDKRQMSGTSSQYARKIAASLDISEAWLRDRIRSTKGNFVWLRRRVDIEYGQKVATLNLPGIRVEKDSRRVYPHHEVASHVLGFTDADNQGIAGAEMSFNDQLTGKTGLMVIQRDGRGRAVPENIIAEVKPQDGDAVVLTIDYILQTIAAEELRGAVREFDATSGSVIISNPVTGEVLAMASEPSYNPNAPASYSLDARRNRAITDIFEPGSTFKITPFTAILEKKLKTPEQVIYCERGSFLLNGRRIRDPESHESLTIADVLKYSSNIGTIKATLELGKQGLYDTATAFGFGNRTHIELSGEIPGLLRPLDKWTSFTLPSVAIGQEISVTALQMVMAYGAVANGGFLLQPQILRAVKDEDGKLIENKFPKIVRRVMSRETAATLTGLLVRVVEGGTGKAAAIRELAIAGKTGTAQKSFDDRKGYSPTDFVASFIGFFPADHPKYEVFVNLETARENQWGATAAAPTFKRIAERIRVYDRTIQSRYTQNTSKPTNSIAATEIDSLVLPDLTNKKFELARDTLKGLGLEVATEGKGNFVATTIPPAGTRLVPGSEVTVQLFAVVKHDGLVPMPSVIGLSLRQALNRLAIENLDPVLYGHGKVVRQTPTPGTLVRAGARCVIECEAPAEKFFVIMDAGR